MKNNSITKYSQCLFLLDRILVDVLLIHHIAKCIDNMAYRIIQKACQGLS